MATLDQSVLQLAAHLHCQRLDQASPVYTEAHNGEAAARSLL